MAEINLGRVVGSDANVTKVNVENALGYSPEDKLNIGSLSGLNTTNKSDIVSAINEVDNEVSTHKADYAKEATQNSISFVSGYVSSPAYVSNYYKKNGIVSLDCQLKKSDSTALTKGSYLKIATLPVGFRPKQEINFAGIASNNSYPMSVRISTAGDIHIFLSNTLITIDVTAIIFITAFYAGGGTV